MAKKLGFGCMRLPILDKDDQTSFDYEKINELFDTFIEKGFTYFDVAYTYHNYQAEKAVKKCLVERHKRDEFTLTTKLPMRDIKTVEDQEKVFNEQLENCGVDYFDYYLLHNIGANSYKTAQKLDSFDFGLDKKKKGQIKNFGFSFHDTPELLEEILKEHADQIDFVQLQINYIDWENPAVQSKKCYEVARKYNKPIIVMEPCKGGTLANIPEEAEKLMKDYHKDMSIPSWAIRFAASQEGVMMVLSGMNTMEQVLDNTSYMENFQPIDDKEQEIINKVVDIINKNTAIPCTACRYCEHGCPMKIAIPDYFALYNSLKRTTGSFSSQQVYYLNLAANHGKAGDCLKCGKCEQACPQHLQIRKYLEEVSKTFDVAPSFPKRK